MYEGSVFSYRCKKISIIQVYQIFSSLTHIWLNSVKANNWHRHVDDFDELLTFSKVTQREKNDILTRAGLIATTECHWRYRIDFVEIGANFVAIKCSSTMLIFSKIINQACFCYFTPKRAYGKAVFKHAFCTAIKMEKNRKKDK